MEIKDLENKKDKSWKNNNLLLKENNKKIGKSGFLIGNYYIDEDGATVILDDID